MRVFRGVLLPIAIVAALAVMLAGTANAEMLAHYEFNEPVGPADTLADSAAAGGLHTLTQKLTSGAGQIVYDADRGGNVLYQPATSAYEMAQGTPGSLDLPAQSSMTLAGWFKQESSASTSLYIYALMLGYNGSEPICSLGFLRDGTIVSYIETDYGDAINASNKDQMNVYTAPGAIVLDANYAFDAWHHVAVVYDRSSDIATIYLDGVAQQTTSQENLTSANTYANGDISYLSDTHGFSFDSRDSNDSVKNGPGSVGYYTSTSANFRGRLDDLRVYSHALSAGEIAQLAEVPEPSTFVLLSLAMLCGLGIRRRG